MNRRLLEGLLSQPQAPYREERVKIFVRDYLTRKAIPYFEDRTGNLVVGVRSPVEYRKKVGTRSKRPAVVFMAHMDHPGFHGVRWLTDRDLAFRWFGGSPTRSLSGAKVWVADDSGYRDEGALEKVKLLPNGRAIESGTVRLNHLRRGACPNPNKLFGAFSFRGPAWFQRDLVYTKGADDLISIYSILQLMAHLKRVRSKAAFCMGLLTRAEEVGFIGAIGHFGLGWLNKAKRPLLCVSLETSRTLPGAEIGKGVVLRVGDKATIFGGAPFDLLRTVAEKKLKGAYQKRIMDGGTCEGTVAAAFGYPTAAISIPLGNYHNEGFERGPDCRAERGPAPEFVSLSDVKGMLEICLGLVETTHNWAEPWAERVRDLRDRYRAASCLLGSPGKTH